MLAWLRVWLRPHSWQIDRCPHHHGILYTAARPKLLALRIYWMTLHAMNSFRLLLIMYSKCVFVYISNNWLLIWQVRFFFYGFCSAHLPSPRTIDWIESEVRARIQKKMCGVAKIELAQSNLITLLKLDYPLIVYIQFSWNVNWQKRK